MNELQKIITTYHDARWPDHTELHQVAKLCEETGEVARAVNTGRGDKMEELADVLIVAFSLAGDEDLLEVTRKRFQYITDPDNGHRSAMPKSKGTVYVCGCPESCASPSSLCMPPRVRW